MARFASATGASSHDLDVIRSSSIELQDYPVPPTSGPRQSHSESRLRSSPQSDQATTPGFQSWTREASYSEKPVRLWVEALRRRAQRPRDVDAKMKFSHSIQFNAVPEWSSYYIAYSNLKKLYVCVVFLAVLFC